MAVAHFLGTGIFWTALAGLAFLLMLATMIGRAGWDALPFRLRGPARFYLSPALGLSVLVIFASLLGRHLPLGDSIVPPLLVAAMLAWALRRERSPMEALRHAGGAGAFGALCGASLLVPLYRYGAFDAHNDAFTYLVHGNWLQGRAFDDALPAEQVTARETQIALYQRVGLRMGASFFLALAQALLNLAWSTEAYPAVVIAALAAGCLAMGFPLARVIRPLRKAPRLALLALPALSLGGLVFGATQGFMPQTFGLALGAAALYLAGPLLRWLGNVRPAARSVAGVVPPGVALFAGAIYAYSELAPFLALALLGSGLFAAWRFKAWRTIGLFLAFSSGLALLLLNTELLRAYTALKVQSGIVVGASVDWRLPGFIAHGFGIHGGAWEGFRWALRDFNDPYLLALGVALSILVIVLILSAAKPLFREIFNAALLPSALISAVFLAALLYFRYFVKSPFAEGTGQSWNQFKLAEWMHPFAMVFLLFSIARLRRYIRQGFDAALISLCLVALVSTAAFSLHRIRPFIEYYSDTRDLNQFYLGFRAAVLKHCPASSAIYLDLDDHHEKFREMAALYLPDRVVKADWSRDVYIGLHLSENQKSQALALSDCVVESPGAGNSITDGFAYDRFRIGPLGKQGRIIIDSASGVHKRETDGNHWWHWVEHEATFKVHAFYIPANTHQTRVRFEYQTRGPRTLTVLLHRNDGSNQAISLQSNGERQQTFDQLVSIPPAELSALSIGADGPATPLSEQDPRMASLIIRDIDITLTAD